MAESACRVLEGRWRVCHTGRGKARKLRGLTVSTKQSLMKRRVRADLPTPPAVLGRGVTGGQGSDDQISCKILVENDDGPPRTTALNSRGLDALGIGRVKLAGECPGAMG